jgi:glycerate 2-kinase
MKSWVRPNDGENRNLSTNLVVVACASFKGTLSSREAGQAIARGLKRVGVETMVVVLADGGEGLVDALL